MSQIQLATIFLAKYLAIYAQDLSTLVLSLPENAPPPCLPTPPYVSMMIFLQVKPASQYGPPILKIQVGLI